MADKVPTEKVQQGQAQAAEQQSQQKAKPQKKAQQQQQAQQPQRQKPKPAKTGNIFQRAGKRILAGTYPTKCYVWFFVFYTILSEIALQWAVNPEKTGEAIWTFFIFPFRPQSAWRMIPVLNFIVIAAFYLFFVFLINRFWLSSSLFITVVAICSLAERMKVSMREEAILPSDVTMSANGNAAGIADFIPQDSLPMILGMFAIVALIWVVNMVLWHLDGQKAAVFQVSDWARLKTKASQVGARIASQIATVFVTGLLIVLFSMNLGTSGTFAHGFAWFFGDVPHLWNSLLDAQGNGTAIDFLRFINVKVMDKPKAYSQETMKKLEAKYSAEATKINSTRKNTLTDENVVLILSESFSDPTRVPGVKLNKDPMPFIRSLKEKTTSGLMVSSGYGGGTANLEFMAGTGLSMANFSPSLVSPYQQLVPALKWIPTFNQLWNEAGSTSLGFHPYMASMYARAQNYQKFGFSHFWAKTGTSEKFTPQNKSGKSPYVNDASSYTAVVNALKSGKYHNAFYQLETMQNHMDYKDWYPNNEFEATSTTAKPLTKKEEVRIKTYAKGVEITDNATKKFLTELDELKEPVTVIWYGDHLPGIYASAAAHEKNTLKLHETDYFIWSNKASSSHKAKLSEKNSAYSSPNFFMAQAAEHTNSKVSPYLAFLTRLHEQLPAMEPPVVNKIQGWSSIPSGAALFVDSQGKQLDLRKLTAQQKQLMEEYRLIQYDITAGHQYLKNSNFLTLQK